MGKRRSLNGPARAAHLDRGEKLVVTAGDASVRAYRARHEHLSSTVNDDHNRIPLCAQQRIR